MNVNPRSRKPWARIRIPAMLCLLGFSGCDKPPEKSVLDGKWKTAPKSLSKDSDSPDLSQNVDYMPRKVLDGSGYGWVMNAVKPWPSDSSLEQIWKRNVF